MSIIYPKDPKGPAKFRCAQGVCRECLEALMERHERLIHSVLRQQSGGELSYEELLQAGRIGLWRAVLQFDTGRGVAFSTYAWMVIKRKIWREVAQSQMPQDWLKPESPPDPIALATVLSRTQLADTRDIPAAERRLLTKHFVSTTPKPD